MANSKKGVEAMSIRTEPAVCSGGSPKQTASNNQLLKAYPKAESVSSLKILVGGLLLFGNKNQKVFWPLFDALLRQYVGLRLISQGGSEQPESTNGEQPDKWLRIAT
jgi:hypothetical protein